jgi:hypothetical protein
MPPVVVAPTPVIAELGGVDGNDENTRAIEVETILGKLQDDSGNNISFKPEEVRKIKANLIGGGHPNPEEVESLARAWYPGRF